MRTLEENKGQGRKRLIFVQCLPWAEYFNLLIILNDAIVLEVDTIIPIY